MHFAALSAYPLLLAVAQMCVLVVVVVTGLVVFDVGVQSDPTFAQVWIVAPEVASENVTVTVPE
jgi:type IV secretory pathway VirB3-like protein